MPFLTVDGYVKLSYNGNMSEPTAQESMDQHLKEARAALAAKDEQIELLEAEIRGLKTFADLCDKDRFEVKAALAAMTKGRDEANNGRDFYKDQADSAASKLTRLTAELDAVRKERDEAVQTLVNRLCKSSRDCDTAQARNAELERAIQEAFKRNGQWLTFKAILSKETADLIRSVLSPQSDQKPAVHVEDWSVLKYFLKPNDGSGVEGHAGTTSESQGLPPSVVCDRQPSHGSGIVTGQSENQASPAITSLQSPDQAGELKNCAYCGGTGIIKGHICKACSGFGRYVAPPCESEEGV